MTPEVLFTLADARGIQYARVSRGTKPQWAVEDVALAMADMYPKSERDRRYAAYAWRWRHDRAQLPMLRFSLLCTAAERAYVERWPQQISGDAYIERLVDLAILEEHHWQLLRTRELYAPLMEVDEEVWRRRLSRRYEAVRHQIESWCGAVHYHMLARIKAEEGA